MGYDVYLTLAIVAGPFALRKGLQLYRQLTEARTASPSKSEPSAGFGWSDWLRVSLLLCQATSNVLTLWLNTPVSIFAKLNLSFSAPNSDLYARTLASNHTLADMELLTHIKTYDRRVVYMLVGQSPLLECAACQTREDYQLFALLPIVRHYVALATVVGLLTMGRGREAWRVWLVVLLLGCVGAEWYSLVVQWDPHVFLPAFRQMARQMASLSLSLIAFFLPTQPERVSIADALGPPLAQLVQATSEIADSVSFGTAIRTSLLRDPSSRAGLIQFWETENAQSRAAKSSLAIQNLYAAQGLERQEVKGEDGGPGSVVEGPERQSARAWVNGHLGKLEASASPKG